MTGLRRIRGAIGMGLTWAVGWAIGGLSIGVASILLPGLPWNRFFEVFDAPLPALAVPGFFAGLFFSAVLGIAGRGRRFRELSLPRFAAWGALGGLLLALFPFALVALGLASREGSNVGTGQIVAVITPLFVLLSTASASVTLILARNAERRESGGIGEGAIDAGVFERQAHGSPATIAATPPATDARQPQRSPADSVPVRDTGGANGG
jgi:hypothetical protein